MAAGDEAAFEVGVLLYRDVVAVVSCIQAALFGDAGVVGLEVALAVVAGGRDAVAYGDLAGDVLLFAVVGGGVLQACYCEVAAYVGFDAFACYLRAFEGGVACALQGGLALAAADMGVAPGGFVAIGVAFAVVGACGDAKGGTSLAKVDGYACIEA